MKGREERILKGRKKAQDKERPEEDQNKQKKKE
jgi:hypothetical protein